MKDARHPEPFWFNAVEDNVSSVFHTTQAGPDLITSTAKLWIIGELPAALFESADIADVCSSPHLLSE